jgi:hypothetical protein
MNPFTHTAHCASLLRCRIGRLWVGSLLLAWLMFTAADECGNHDASAEQHDCQEIPEWFHRSRATCLMQSATAHRQRHRLSKAHSTPRLIISTLNTASISSNLFMIWRVLHVSNLTGCVRNPSLHILPLRCEVQTARHPEIIAGFNTHVTEKRQCCCCRSALRAEPVLRP